MNAENYASLEASRRLVEAGIALETDILWVDVPGVGWRLVDDGAYHEVYASCASYPAPSMAEVWKELPFKISRTMRPSEYLYISKTINNRTFAAYAQTLESRGDIETDDTNPTDALIDILIGVNQNANSDTGRCGTADTRLTPEKEL